MKTGKFGWKILQRELELTEQGSIKRRGGNYKKNREGMEKKSGEDKWGLKLLVWNIALLRKINRIYLMST